MRYQRKRRRRLFDQIVMLDDFGRDVIEDSDLPRLSEVTHSIT